MTSKLTRDKVVGEIDDLAREAAALEERILNLSSAGFSIRREAFDELLKDIRLAKALTCDNLIDFRQVELILMELRQAKSSITAALSIAVRPVTSADAPELAALLNGIIARGGTTALEKAFTPERLDETYLTGPDVLSCVVAVDADAGRLEGFQTLIREAHLPEDWGDIGTFSRVGGTQRGIGSALFAATSERARALGLAGMNAEIRADNEGGLAFYGKMGFQDHEVARAVPLSDGTPVDRIHKRYKLNLTNGR